MNLRNKIIAGALILLSLPHFTFIKADEQDCSDGYCSEPDYEGSIDCDSCCAGGHSASEQCLRRCNGCLMRNDEATSNYNDWPFAH